MTYSLMRFWEISKGLSDAEEGFKKGTLKENEFLLEFAEAVRQYNGEIREAFRYTHERLDRLHQKIDRIEAKIASAPRK